MIRHFYQIATLIMTQLFVGLILFWIGLRIMILVRNYLSRHPGGNTNPGVPAAGNGRRHIGPRD
jgi:hypothetical protein